MSNIRPSKLITSSASGRLVGTEDKKKITFFGRDTNLRAFSSDQSGQSPMFQALRWHEHLDRIPD